MQYRPWKTACLRQQLHMAAQAKAAVLGKGMDRAVIIGHYPRTCMALVKQCETEIFSRHSTLCHLCTSLAECVDPKAKN